MLNNDFDRHFRQSQRSFNIMFRIIATIVFLAFIVIIGFWIFAGTMAVKAAGEIEQQGVKSVVEQIWCGKDKPDCLK